MGCKTAFLRIMKVYMMKNPLAFAFIMVPFLLYVQCTPAKPANESEITSEGQKTAPEVTRAFADAGLPVFTQRIASMDFSASPVDGNSGSITLAEFKGKVVFLNFWASWCGPCRAEMPSMEALYRRFKGDGLEILAVNYRENKKTVDAFTEQFNLTFPVTLDLSGRIGGLYGVGAFPTTYIIDREGKIVTRIVGSLDWNTPELFAAFESLLDS
jgi:thiol-disulfide isomerase/thioredoxin